MDKTLLILRVERGREAQAGGVISLREFSRLQTRRRGVPPAASKRSCAGEAAVRAQAPSSWRFFRAAKFDFVAGLP